MSIGKPITLIRLEEDEEMDRLINELQAIEALEEPPYEDDPEYEEWCEKQIKLSAELSVAKA